jgi:hypothetical protein
MSAGRVLFLGNRIALVATMTLVVFGAGCMKTVMVVDHSVVLSLAEDEQRSCAADCPDKLDEGNYARCLSACGGARVERRGCEEWWGKPPVACAAVRVFSQEVDGATTATVLGALALVIFSIARAARSSGGSSGGGD